MSKLRRITTIGGTVGCALGIGFFMQREPAQPMPQEALATVEIEETVLQTVAEPLQLEDIQLTSALPDPTVEPEPAIMPRTPIDPEMPILGCAIETAATATHAAMVSLDVSAPCFVNERVTVHHHGMIFTTTTDAEGRIAMQVPALAPNAVFLLDFAGGQSAVAQASVPEVLDYERVVLQWSGVEGFQLHAREFGAAYGAPGHVWSGAAQSEADRPGGFLTRLGAADTLEPHLAEVYSYPRQSNDGIGTVALTVEAEVTAENCGQQVSAQSL